MDYLLDTRALLLVLADSSKIQEKPRSILEDKRNRIHVSSVTFWELSFKTVAKKFQFAGMELIEVPVLVQGLGFSILNLSADEAISFDKQPVVKGHSDPFERMLCWQALRKKMTFVSTEDYFLNYSSSGLLRI